jgi:hypothetical protein
MLWCYRPINDAPKHTRSTLTDYRKQLCAVLAPDDCVYIHLARRTIITLWPNAFAAELKQSWLKAACRYA